METERFKKAVSGLETERFERAVSSVETGRLEKAVSSGETGSVERAVSRLETGIGTVPNLVSRLETVGVPNSSSRNGTKERLETDFVEEVCEKENNEMKEDLEDDLVEDMGVYC